MPRLTHLALAIAFVALGTSAPEAASRRGDPAPGYVTAESRFGHGTVSGPVRQARAGREVRLPGGTWIACGRSCAETLRIETVDFWENKGAGRSATDNECGLFGCLSRGLRF
jgi:hypothetical protein